MGEEGYARLGHSFQNLVEWVLRVEVLEFGARAISEMSGLSAVTIAVHHWIAYIGMVGFVISEILYEVRCIVGQIAEIRAVWKRSCGARPHRR